MAIIVGTPSPETIGGTIDADSISGFTGSDTIIGGVGHDTIDGGEGDDDFLWFDPSDGNDSINGGLDQANNFDELVVFGTGGDDFFNLSFGGGQAVLSHLASGSQINTVEVEGFQITPGAGADHVFIGNMFGVDTVAENVFIDLAGNGGANPSVVDGVTLLAHNPVPSLFYNVIFFEDLAQINFGNGTGEHSQKLVVVRGMSPVDTFHLAGGNQADRFRASGVRNATMSGGAGDDTIEWFQRGTFSDGRRILFDGGTGRDTVLTADSQTVLSKVGNLVALGHSWRDGGLSGINNAQLQGVEVLKVSQIMSGGVSTLTIGDLSGTDLREIAVTSSSAGVLRLTVDGSSAPDVITGATDAAGQLGVTGLSASIQLSNTAGVTELTVRGGVGADTMNFSGVDSSSVKLTLLGGLNGDRIIGSRGADVIEGGSGHDSLTGGAGDDVFRFDQIDPNRGLDIITDFQAHDGAGFNDRIDLNGIDFDDVTLSQQGADTLVLVNGVAMIRLVGVLTTSLNSSDFLAA